MDELLTRAEREQACPPRTTIDTLVTALSAAVSKPPGTSHR